MRRTRLRPRRAQPGPAAAERRPATQWAQTRPTYLVLRARRPAVRLPGRRLRLRHLPNDAGQARGLGPVLPFLWAALGVGTVGRARGQLLLSPRVPAVPRTKGITVTCAGTPEPAVPALAPFMGCGRTPALRGGHTRHHCPEAPGGPGTVTAHSPESCSRQAGPLSTTAPPRRSGGEPEGVTVKGGSPSSRRSMETTPAPSRACGTITQMALGGARDVRTAAAEKSQVRRLTGTPCPHTP